MNELFLTYICLGTIFVLAIITGMVNLCINFARGFQDCTGSTIIAILSIVGGSIALGILVQAYQLGALAGVA